jgi:Kef-type K+ transport system membrane component KefB
VRKQIVAVLVNTRGLTELIALNVGFSAGLISHQLFNVLVLMAVLTTILTAPLLRLIRPTDAEPRNRDKQKEKARVTI